MKNGAPKTKALVQKIQLRHPQGKKAVSIHKDKYDSLKRYLIKYLTGNNEGTFQDISFWVSQEIKKDAILFDGALNWYLEWVKLDLEAQQIIARVPQTSPQKYVLLITR